jgi:stage II sporulation protein M
MSWITEEYRHFRQDYLKLFIFYYLTSIVVIIFAYFFYKTDHYAVDVLHNQYIANGKEQGLHTNDEAPWSDFLIIFLNNCWNVFLIVVLGLIPVLVIPFLILIINMTNTSILLVYGQNHTGISPVRLIVHGILPHGIFEMTAVILSIVLGTRLS